MAGDRTSRRCARHRGLKAEPIAPPIGRLALAALPPVQHEGLGADEFDVDPKVAHLLALRRAEPAHELAQAVAVRDDVHGRPVDRRLLAVDRVCRCEEGEHWVIGHAGRVLVHEIRAIVGLQGERDIAPGPDGRRTCELVLVGDIQRGGGKQLVPGATIVGFALSAQLYDVTYCTFSIGMSSGSEG